MDIWQLMDLATFGILSTMALLWVAGAIIGIWLDGR